VIGCTTVGAITLAGCGGGGTSTGASTAAGASRMPGTTPLSQHEFVSKANAACKDYNRKYQALKAPSNSTRSIAAFGARVIPLMDDTYAKLSALRPPTDLRARYRQYQSDAKKQIAFANDVESAAKLHDAGLTHYVAHKGQAHKARLDSEARALSLTECAKSVHPQG
jgi:hypothetical protein